MRNRKIKVLSEEEVSSATPSISQNILITPRKLNFEPQTPFFDLSVIAEKEEEHSPRSLIKSVLETPEGQKQFIELKEKYSDDFYKGCANKKYIDDSFNALERKLDTLSETILEIVISKCRVLISEEFTAMLNITI
ncbi:hypothetical protein CBL_20023 [Carabus blaptoides fortunei]